MRALYATPLFALLIAACDDDAFVCPHGFEREGNECVVPVLDTGVPDTRTRDAGPDVPSSNCTTPCDGDTPICDEGNSVCVQCLLPTDCEGVEGRPMCVDNACVECTGNADCAEPGASVCSTGGTCVPCAAATSADDCAGVVDGATALNVCDESGDAGVCVQCNAGDETACDPNVCDVLAKSCTDDVTMGSAEACEACVSDTQCEGELACIPVGATEPRAHYCMENNSGGCGEPFTVRLMDRTSISGLEATNYCGINETLASCENVRSLLDNDTCPGGSDDECPEGGLCRRVGDLVNRCTYECSGPTQCDAVPNPGASCGNETNLEVGPDYCGGEPGK